MSTPIQPVPPLVLASEFPSLADRPAGTYNAKAKAWADSENAMVTRARETALVTHNNALAAREAADEAVPAAATAVAARDETEDLKDSAWAAAAAAQTSAGLPEPLQPGKVLGATGPDTVDWIDATPSIGVRLVDAAATIGPSDQALMLRCSGTFTLSFEPLANLPAGWFCYLKNAGDGDITLDPSGSETIDGLTSYIMYPGECRLIAHNGTEFVSVVLNGFYKVFTASGSFVKPPGYGRFSLELWGGGGGGAKYNYGTYLVGGAGAGCVLADIRATSLADTESVVIGSGGVGAAAINSAGTAGGNSTFAGITAYGGDAGTSASSARGGAAFFSNTPNDVFAANTNLSGNGGTASFLAGCSVDASTPVPSRFSVYGGGTGGYIALPSTANPYGSTVFGGASVTPIVNATVDGNVPGGGGAPTVSGPRAGNGARGELRIWGII